MTRFQHNFLWSAIGIVAWNVFVFAAFALFAPGVIPAIIEMMP